MYKYKVKNSPKSFTEINGSTFNVYEAEFGTFYVESAFGNSKRILILDSRKEKIAYLRTSEVLRTMKERHISVRDAVIIIASDLAVKSSVVDFLDAIPASYVYVADSFEELLKEYNLDYANEEELFENEFVNKIGNCYVAMNS